MKVRFNLNSGANIHSTNDTGWLDTVNDLGLDEGEWEAYSDDDKYKLVEEYWNGMGYPEMYFEEDEEK